jgi:hypothetical protein
MEDVEIVLILIRHKYLERLSARKITRYLIFGFVHEKKHYFVKLIRPVLMVYHTKFFGQIFALVPYVRFVTGSNHLGMGANFWRIKIW